MAEEGACFKFMIQHKVARGWTIEDGTEKWSQRVAPYNEIARIYFSPQALMEQQTCERLVINPWNTLPAHKPVGGINRIRLPTYLLSVEKRRSSNRY